MTIYIAPTKIFSERNGDKAERKVIDKLREEKLDERLDGWMVFSSKVLPAHTKYRFGEVDLILVAPNFNAVIVAEIKSHDEIRFRGSGSKQTVEVTTKGKEVNASDQLKNNFITFREDIKYFKEQGQLSNNDFHICSCLIFPDAFCDNQEGLSWKRDHIIDKNDFEDSFVDTLIDIIKTTKESEKWRKCKDKMGKNIANQLKDIIESEPKFKVTNKSLIRDAHQEMIRLTENQERLTQEIVKNLEIPVIVDGCAGSGKTIVARNTAISIANLDRNSKILFTCYNNLLADYISNTEGGVHQNIHYAAINIIISDYIKEFEGIKDKLSINLDEYENIGNSGRDHHHSRKLKAVFAAQHGGFEKYTALIIDEYPDMMEKEVLEFLDAILDGGFSNGIWRAFGDLAQDILAKTNTEFKTMLAETLGNKVKVYQRELMENIRNSRQISDLSSKVIKGINSLENRQDIESLRACSWPIEHESYNDNKDLVNYIKDCIDRWISRGFSEKSITIILPSGRIKNLRNDLKRIESDNITFTNIDSLKSPRFGCSTARSFKGCENDIIIIIDPESLAGTSSETSKPTDEERALAYVAMTRAKIGLSLLYKESSKSKYQDLIGN